MLFVKEYKFLEIHDKGIPAMSSTTNLFAVAVQTPRVLREALIGIRITGVIKERLADEISFISLCTTMAAAPFTHISFLRAQTG